MSPRNLYGVLIYRIISWRTALRRTARAARTAHNGRLSVWAGARDSEYTKPDHRANEFTIEFLH